jgi:hypothetical protein
MQVVGIVMLSSRVCYDNVGLYVVATGLMAAVMRRTGSVSLPRVSRATSLRQYLRMTAAGVMGGDAHVRHCHRMFSGISYTLTWSWRWCVVVLR